MICGSCRRRCDPNRSFCTNCGSSVFINERDEAAFFGRSVVRPSAPSTLSGQLRELQRAATSIDRTAALNAAKARARARAARSLNAAPVVPALRLAPFIKLAIFVFVVWYAASWALRISEVRALKDAFQQGVVSDEMLRAARDAVLARIEAALRRAQEPAPPDSATPVEKPPATPVERPRSRPAERTPETSAEASNEGPAGRLVPPPDNADLPPGVSLPGDDVTMPRVLHRVSPAYTPEARRANVEGTVILWAVVRTHGIPGDISVVRSFDRRFGLDQEAVAALRQWRFAPGQRAGRPVPVLVQIEMPFVLK